MRRHLFNHLLWSLFQSLLHIYKFTLTHLGSVCAVVTLTRSLCSYRKDTEPLCSFLGFNAFIASLLCRKGKQGIKCKAGAIKCLKEIKITAPHNEWRNIPFNSSKLFYMRRRSILTVSPHV